MKNQLQILYKEHKVLKEVTQALKNNDLATIFLNGLKGSSSSLALSVLFEANNKINIIALGDKEDAAYFYDDLINLFNEDEVLFFPSTFKRSVQYYQPDNENIVLRTEVLSKIISYNKNAGKNLIIVTYPEAIVEKVISNEQLNQNTLSLKLNENISIDFLNEVLIEYEFERVDFVYEPGQYSVRGSIVDIFSFSSEFPFRIDFFGNDVDSIRSFDIQNQLSKNKHDEILITPNIQNAKIATNRISLFEFLPDNSIIYFSQSNFIFERINEIYNNTDINEIDELEDIDNKDSIIINADGIKLSIKKFQIIEFGHQNYFNPDKIFEFNTIPQPKFNKNFELLDEKLKYYSSEGYTNYILSSNQNQINRLNAIFEEIDQQAEYTTILKVYHQGFVDHDLQICCFTDHEIFERYHKYKLKKNFTNKAAFTLKELQGLNPGDYVVHADHGIGKFGGLEKIDINGKKQETIRLIYKDNDMLYVSIHSLHKISKYKGKDGTAPKIYKLGTGAWQKLKQNTKNKVKDIAKNLIALYAKRKQEKGFMFSPDTYMQKELEASFIYEDTPDQEKATRMVKEGMESSMPMDLLVCGDVGFGKTEVAIRAAFKAVADNKQVAVLVPTTILALQHFNTFSDRLKDFPCTVDFINRFRTAKQQKEIINKVNEGKIDILIGTHRIVGKDIKFKDLGLLIIDEEQKFGVAVKEKLKNLKVNVDSLILTATPIPRTLQFSLMGARDLSIINTPPPNRHPILTELHTFNEDIIREAITYEIDRGGQVFFLHNRVQNITEMESLINKIVPGITTAHAHGQMEGNELEKIILNFIDGKFDVLVSTSIIESGLDIPNTNTIIINNANNFGLSDLHQLRGRVGRSNKKAFCYLLAPPITTLTAEARRRLKAIEDFSDLGSGFNISLQDLDIRGAGNLLGGEQSGFIADIGFETYHKILNEALQELKENEFADVFADELKAKQDNFITDCHIDTDLEILFPDIYISNTSERMRLYKELDNIGKEDDLLTFKNKLIDRFGDLPSQTEDLLKVVSLRWIAINLGFEKIILKNGKMLIFFISNQMSSYYQSKVFLQILKRVQNQPKKFKMKENKNKLSLTVDNVSKIETAKKVLDSLSLN